MDANRRQEVLAETLRLLQLAAGHLGELRDQRTEWPELEPVWAVREQGLLTSIGKCWDLMAETYRKDRNERIGQEIRDGLWRVNEWAYPGMRPSGGTLGERVRRAEEAAS